MYFLRHVNIFVSAIAHTEVRTYIFIYTQTDTYIHAHIYSTVRYIKYNNIYYYKI